MDRLTRTLAGFGLALVASAGGCRTAHDEVPPGKMYRPDNAGAAPAPGAMGAAPGGQAGFSTSPADRAVGPGMAMTPPNIGGGGGYGSQGPGASPYGAQAASGPYGGVPSNDVTGATPGGRFGGPGTSGLAGSSMDPGVRPATGGNAGGGMVDSLPGLGSAPPLGGSPGAAPSAAPRTDAGSLNGFPTAPAASGMMGSPGQAPSPL